jgi:hypothetical protein
MILAVKTIMSKIVEALLKPYVYGLHLKFSKDRKHTRALRWDKKIKRGQFFPKSPGLHNPSFS